MGNYHFQKESENQTWNKIQVNFLKEVIDLFDKYEIKYWLDGGTLLGLYRDEQLIDGDNDIDVCIKVEDLDDNFFKMFDDLHKKCNINHEGNLEIHKHYKNSYKEGSIKHFEGTNSLYRILKNKMEKVGDKYYWVCCDVIILFPYQDFYFYKCLTDYCFRFKSKVIESCSYINAYDKSIRIPTLTKEYLDTIYTENWVIDRDFDGYNHDYFHNWKNWKTELPEDYTYHLK